MGNTYAWDVANPGETRELLEGVNLRDNTHDTNRDGPEDDKGGNNSVHSIAADYQLPPGNVKALPHDITRLDTDVAGRHLQGVVMSGDL
jgi:hypothetical protein